MSAFPSESGCRSYRDELEAVPQAPVRLDVLRKYGEDDGFCLPLADGLRAVATPGAALVFTAHSIPSAQAARCDYEASLRRAATRVCELAGWDGPWQLAWQSRSGPPQVPWLEPDVGQVAAAHASEGVRDLVVVPIGFTSDHVEVVWDLDTALAQQCRELGLGLHRVPTVGTDPRFVQLLVDLVEERRDGPEGPGCPGGVSCCRAGA